MNTVFYFQNPGAPRPNRPNHLGTVVLLRFRGKVLLEHRTDSEVWAFIGGALELDETLKAGAVREVKEETGCTLKDLQYLCCFYPAVGALDTKVYAFCATVDTEATSFDTNEVQGKQWMSVKDALNLLQSNEMRNGISMLSILYALQFREKL